MLEKRMRRLLEDAIELMENGDIYRDENYYSESDFIRDTKFILDILDEENEE